MRIGTAGWSITRATSASFPGVGPHLQRYSQVLGCAEINSSFYRHHRFEVYERWAAQTPPGFRFSAKVPRSITHDGRLRRAREPLLRFLSEAAGLAERLAVVLVQLPPSLVFEARPVRKFFDLLAELYDGTMVCEPRHASWFTPAAERVLAALHVSRAAADPAGWPEASRPGGWLGPDGEAPYSTIVGTVRRGCTGRVTRQPGCKPAPASSCCGPMAPTAGAFSTIPQAAQRYSTRSNCER